MSVMTYVEPRTRNTYGNVALAATVVGGLAVATAILLSPVALYLGLPLLALALVLAVVGLTRSTAPKAASIAALVFSVVLAAAAPVTWGVVHIFALIQR
ncbi:MAG TPA: hypothetical protein VN107_05700 [Microbacterium sp.]|nr:hypothetical protein [Microbacterium sp.]